jgi:DNA-binding LacI/PurR family transcriptional regulator
MEVTRRFLRERRPDAVIAGSFYAAQRLALAAMLEGQRIPEDLLVVAIDQHPGLVEWFGPQLPPTVHLPLEAMGREAVFRLKRLIAGGTAESLPLPSQLRFASCDSSPNITPASQTALPLSSAVSP